MKINLIPDWMRRKVNKPTKERTYIKIKKDWIWEIKKDESGKIKKIYGRNFK